MSQYISSFFIDPVVRQARRFSRPSFSAEETEQDHNVLATSPPAASTGPAQYLNFRTPSFNLPYLLSSKEVVSSPALPAFSDDAWLESDQTGAPQLVEIGSLEPAIRARQYAVRYSRSKRPRSQDATCAGSPSSVAVPKLPIRRVEQPVLVDAVTQSLRTDYNAPNGLNTRPSVSKNGGLAEDDGMGQLRRKILAIQQADSTSEVKAKMIYGLMTERYSTFQQTSPSRARSPVSIESSGRPYTPSSPKSTESLRPSGSPPTSSSSAGDTSNPFELAPEDFQPTYWENSLPDQREPQSLPLEHSEETKHLGCAHYKRNIKLQCSACSRWYTCRFCHDAVEDHMLNRRETKCMLCMLCGCAQPASQQCVLCTSSAAWYYCDVCKLWDDDPSKEIYHCEDCGICRIGAGIGKSHLHCKTCNVCMEISHFQRHRCLERSTECNCPICGEYLFTSPNGVVFMPCGHSIHRTCYSELMRATYRCPICSRSIANMERQFLDLKREIEVQPMPEEFQDTKACIYCNDCSAKTDVKYHWLGLECAVCSSFNTVQLSLLTANARPTVPLAQPVEHTRPIPVQLRRHSIDHFERPTSRSLPIFNPFAPALAFPRLDHARPRPSRQIRHHSAITPGAPSDDTGQAGQLDDSGADDDDDYSEVEFWGGESPRLRAAAASARVENEVALESESESEDEDEDDNDDDDDIAIDDDDEAESQPGLLDQLDMPGHR